MVDSTTSQRLRIARRTPMASIRAAALTGIAAGLIDGISHSANFKGEAIMTGFAAAGLCLVFSIAVARLKTKTNSKNDN